jgi:ketosteroid isomerase-like protein
MAMVLMALVVGGCGGKDRASKTDVAADEAAIRQSLAEIQRAFNAGEYDAMFAQYRDDVLVSAPGQPEIVGKAEWRAGFGKMPSNVALKVRFDTQEISVSGDLGYERGTFTMDMADRSSGSPVGSVTIRHVHIFRRDADGRWRGWRLIENSADSPPAVPGATAPKT